MIPIPPYIDPEAWAGFVTMRKAMGKTVPFTVRAATLILKELQLLKAQGYDPNACLDQSTMKGWRGVFATPHKAVTGSVQQGNTWLEEQERHRQALEDPEAKQKVSAAKAEALAKLQQLRIRRVA
jgi:hypothetical protein